MSVTLYGKVSTMSKYEPYEPDVAGKPDIVGKAIAAGVTYRLAALADAGTIAALTVEREGGRFPTFLFTVNKQLKDNGLGEDFALFVAVKDNEVIGFGRVAKHDPEKSPSPYPSPAGWYLLGMIVRKDFRRMGIGSGLVRARFDWLKSKDVSEVYSMVSSENRTSIDLHTSLGFRIVQEGAGFCSVTFDCGKGYLLCKEL